MAFIDEFADVMPDVLLVQAGYLDAYGAFVESGAQQSRACRIRGGVRVVKDRAGREVVSSVRAVMGGVFGLTADLHRYTLPSRFVPNADLEAIDVVKVSDEGGPCYEVVLLP